LLAAVGEDGVRSYTAPPLLPDRSDVARRQAELWGNPRRRISVARHMYALRLGEALPHRDLDTLRGIEGARVKAIYRLMAQKYGIDWEGRHYDRANPNATDIPNQAINHAATAVQAAAALRCKPWLHCPRWVLSMKTQGSLLCWTSLICTAKPLPCTCIHRCQASRKIR